MGFLYGERADAASAYEEYEEYAATEADGFKPAKPAKPAKQAPPVAAASARKVTAGDYYEELGKLADSGVLDGWATNFVNSMLSRGPGYKCSVKQIAVIKKLIKEHL